MNRETPVATTNPLTGWLTAVVSSRHRAVHGRIMSGSLIMLFGSGMVSAINLFYNVGIARLLGPAAFGHAAVVYTILMLMSAVTLSFQLVCAKFVAKNDTAATKAAVYSSLLRRSWRYAIVIGGILAAASVPLAQYLNLPSANLVLLLAVGVTFYIPLGVKRGGMQGIYAFEPLAINYVLEGLVKLLAAFLLIKLGLGITGAVMAIAASVVLAYFFAKPGAELEVKPETGIPAHFREGMQAIVFFIGQVIINNIDIVLVKHFFDPEKAGLYAAAALIGRVVYVWSWSVVSTMFPISAGMNDKKHSEGAVLITPLLLVLAITGSFTLGLWLFPNLVWRTVFGAGFQQGQTFYSSLLVLYAGATGVYSLAVVLMTYEMSRKIANTGWMQLAFSGVIVLGIYLFHDTLQEVVVVQLVIMTLLLIAVSLPFISGAQPRAEAAEEPAGRLVKRRRLSEDEVIAEFLKNEFYHKEFNRYRDTFHSLVFDPDLTNERDNALRRALLFRRRGPMWRELPQDTQWWEVQVETADLGRMCVLPRDQWLRLARGSFYLTDIVDRIRAREATGGTNEFISKIRYISQHLRKQRVASSVLLIGVDEASTLTIIEGNHRLTAAMLVSAEIAPKRFRFLCGLSPRMTECCWYQTNVMNVLRYVGNRVRHCMDDPDLDISRVLEMQPLTPAVAPSLVTNEKNRA